MVTLVFKSAGATFIDQVVVKAAVGKTAVKAFRRFGAFVMRTARKSIRKARKKSAGPRRGRKPVKQAPTISAPGDPPVGHVGFLKTGIRFAADERGVVIGPERLSRTLDPAALAALEYGGRSTALDHGRRKQTRVRARPFMGPAFARELPGLPAMWARSIP